MIFYVVLVLAIVAEVAVRVTHPALTETQLFLQFWWLWLALCALPVASLWLPRRRV